MRNYILMLIAAICLNISSIDNDQKIKNSDRKPMAMINNELYFDTNKESDINARCGIMDGKIISTVDTSEIPTQNNQSNFGSNYSYQYVDENNIDIYINEKWIRFEKENKNIIE